MQVSPLPPSFFSAYNLCTSSLGCKALCIVMSFLFSGPFAEVLLWPQVSYKKDSQSINLFDEVSVI